jgi:ATP-binding cassette, subfamily B, bacterial MsbA
MTVHSINTSSPRLPRLDAAFGEINLARRVLALARGERRIILLVGLLGLASAVFEGLGLSFLIPLAGLAMGEAIDFDIPVIGPVLAWLDARISLGGTEIVAFVFGFFILGIIVGYLNTVVSTMLSMRFAHALRVRVFETALDRPLSAIESLPSGKFVNNLASETWKVCSGLFVVIGAVVQFITFAVFLAFLFLLSPFYTLVLLAMTGGMAFVVHLATRAVRGLGVAGVAANESFMAYVWDALGGLRVIRGFGREAHERTRFVENSDRVRRVFTQMQILSALVGPITRILTVAMVAAILGIAVIRGDSIATLVGFLAIAYRMQPRVTSLLMARTNLRSLEGSLIALEEALEARPVPSRRAEARPFRGLRRGVVLDGVWARYPNAERPALHDISCSFPFGQVTAVAGYSGAGKSTLVALLLRFIEPERGRILIDDVPLSEIDPESWHQRIAFVEQNAFIFNASVRENIGYGDLEAGEEAIHEAARIAQADEFIAALSGGYETMIGENGVRLSQGQRQRIALARALLRKPDVLILDEATNALDRPTERALRAAVEGAGSARAIIVIAHRRETIETADQVIVLDHGRIVEAGSPAELARQGGVYAHLYLDEAPAPPPAGAWQA